MTLLPFFLLLQALTTASFAKDCTLANVYGSCDKIKNAGAILQKNADGSLVPNIYKVMGVSDKDLADPEFEKTYKELISAPKDLKANQKKIDNMLKFIQDTYVSDILEGKKENDPSLDPSTKAMITRLRTVKIVRVDEGFPCEDVAVNAFYLALHHTVIICSGLSKAPDSMLAFILGHEVGHSVDSCNLSLPLMRVKKKIPVGLCKTKLLPFESVDSLQEHAGEFMAVDGFRARADVLKLCQFADTIVEPQFNLGKNKISKTVACVLRNQNTEDLEKSKSFDEFLKSAKQELQNSHPDWSESEILGALSEDDQNLKEAFDQLQEKINDVNEISLGCSNTFSKVRINKGEERTADTLAVGVLKKYLSTHQISEIEKRSLIEYQAQYACSYELSGGKKFNVVSYPAYQERLNILLQEPEIQKALNCTYKGEEKCSERQIQQITDPQPLKLDNQSIKGAK